MKTLLLLSLLLNFVSLKDTISTSPTCPSMECLSQPREDGLCFKHSSSPSNAVTEIQFFPCPEGHICELDYTQQQFTFPERHGGMAWVNSTMQRVEESEDVQMSAVYKKQTEAYCVDKDRFKAGLLAGRRCKLDQQCYYGSCQTGVCRGKSSGSECSKHQECDLGLACRHMQEWPYTTFCLPMRTEGESCFDEFECQFGLKCWYPTAQHVSSLSRVCMKAYSLPDGAEIGYKSNDYFPDLQYLNMFRNGQLCQSLFAIPSSDNPKLGLCASFRDFNHTCDPFNSKNQLNYCKYTFNQESASLTLPCDCTLMGDSNGRCPLPVNSTFRLLGQQMNVLYGKMDYCHTMDRDNLGAFLECGEGISTGGISDTATSNLDSVWADAVRARMEIEIYPQNMGSYQQKCLENHYPHSVQSYMTTVYEARGLYGLVQAGAKQLKGGLIVIVGLIYCLFI
ncbi:hypothetical protein FGO68_gene7416 [Halteria grandinella]|uniref:Uncharacterized protein n=1 Tax=Halteria grandinella TaxID=5974 RepID=A0A8J8NUZ8_HALGN|nr:hypothetical protein FGO68_gene7416 [Halteria grandinella]